MHRPTYFPIKGTTTTLPSRRTCIRDVTAHTTLKVRNDPKIDTSLEQRRQFKEDLLKKEKEEATLSEKDAALISVLKQEEYVNKNMKKGSQLLLTDQVTSEDAEKIRSKWADDDADAIESRDSDNDGFDSSEDEDSDGDDDSDDEAALQAELDKIRSERAAALEKKEEEEREIAEIEARRNAVAGNPLMGMDKDNTGGSSKIKRRWNDDVVFANQSKDEPETKRRFINDVVRSDFHKSFMKKYIK